MQDMFIEKIKILLNHKHPFKLLLGGILRRSGLSMLFTIDRGYYKIKFYPTTGSVTLFAMPAFRQEDDAFYISYLKKDDIVVDVGANIGTEALLSASLVKEDGKVYTFEPNPRIYKYLLKNIKLNGFHNIEPFCTAIGDENSIVELTDLRNEDMNHIIVDKSDNIRTVKTKLSRLEDLVPATIKRINLLKIDTEGYELFVLKGAGNLLEKTDCIYYESWEQLYNQFGYKTQDILLYLKDRDFKIYRVVGKETICEIKNIDNYVSSKFENLIAVKDVDAFTKRTEYKVETKQS